jgi:hypothetical protein
MTGEEVSFFALVDGETVIPFGSAQDHKRVGDGDTGPNTGGMGAYSPASIFTPELEARVMAQIVRPTARALAEAGTPFSGILYAGLMLTPEGAKLVEYNVRFGDPECQALMLRLESDLLALMVATAKGALAAHFLRRGLARRRRRGQGLSGNARERRRHSRPRRRRRPHLPGGDGARKRPAGRRRRPRARRRRARRDRRRCREGRLSRGRSDRLSGRLLPPRHRLARDRTRRLNGGLSARSVMV